MIFGQLAHGASWLVLAAAGLRETAGARGFEFGWLHLVALGWITMTALSVLIHVIPALTDAPWRFERVARGSLAAFAAGTVVLVAGFCAGEPGLLPWGGALIGLGLLGYAVPAGITLAAAFRVGKTEAAIARALATTLGFLLVTAAIGVTFTWALAGRLPGSVLELAPVHGEFGVLGWLTLLVMGVSVKTIGPIAGSRSRAPRRHIVSGGAVLAATLVLAAGTLLFAPVWLWCGLGLLALGAVLYLVDIGVVLRRASVPHRPPQAFVAAALTWFGFAVLFCAGAVAGYPSAKACAYVALAGWVGQMVNAHMHHIGVRVLITRFLGDDDETRPGTVLCAPLSWSAFGLFQIAIAVGAAASLADLPALLLAAAGAGFGAWLMTVANAAYAVRRLRGAAASCQVRGSE